MPAQAYAGKTLELDAEGYLAHSTDWTREIGQAIAAELGVPLTDAHWKAIEFVRTDHEATKQTPGLRRITSQTGISMKDIYALFPKGPAKLIARIAGTPKPKSCL
jgi:TusE/DsrC/DsvC family sulfur relay protein